MRSLIDCHIHTGACGHASGTVADMIAAAHRARLSSVVMTEHLPLPEALNPGGEFAPSHDAFMHYAQEVQRVGAESGMEVVLGAEADWLPHRPEAMERQAETARAAGVQVVLGSVHFIGDWPFDSPSHLGEWESRGADEVWRTYFALWAEAATSGRFDVMAHPDLVKKFGHRPSFDPVGLYASAASAAKEGGVLIEVSTAGLRKPVGEMYPAAALLRAFAGAGVSATVGSDAHGPDEVGHEITQAYEHLLACGYHKVAFPTAGRQARWIEL